MPAMRGQQAVSSPLAATGKIGRVAATDSATAATHRCRGAGQLQSKSRPCDDSSIARLDVVGVIVSDLQRAIAFYQRLVLQFPEDPDPMGHGHVEASLPGGLRFTLDTEESIRSFDPGWSPPSGGHRVAVAFRCES